MNINQGEIWEVEFFPNIGSEIGKKRPALVVSYNGIGKLPLKTIVPITNFSKNFEFYPWIVKISPSRSNGLSKVSGFDCFQVRNFSHHRFIKKIGMIDEETLFNVHKTIVKTLDPSYGINNSFHK
ncbi:type II toxin-antitoxin system PemK/MazF family toxin [Sulfurimonas sp.]|nr:type II toxin-antitoxin system PemK/MazF family toxin [Sulfurimonas sp.]